MPRKRSKSIDEILDTSAYDLTVKELQKAIRYLTPKLNVRIAEYREEIAKGEWEESIVGNIAIEALKATAGTKGVKGEIGLGLKGKNKSQLQKQFQELRRFENKDIFTPEGQREWSAKTEKQYNEFRKNYNEDLTRDEYEQMIDTMNVVKHHLKDYGYEDIGRNIANQFAKASQKNKTKFVDIVIKARDTATASETNAGVTAEDVIDRLKVLLESEFS